MKILHTADLHLGKLLYGVSLIEEQKKFVEEVLYKTIENEKPDVLVISGDIYDRGIAPISAIELFENLIVTINKKYKTPIIMISGNHDSPERLSLASELLKESGVYICTKIKDAFTPVTFSDNGVDYDFWLLPFFEPIQAKEFYKDDNINGFNECYQKILEDIKSNFKEGNVNILLAHNFVTGYKLSGGESPVYVGTSGEVSAELFEEFGYVALGHIHSPQRIKENIYYSGSPLKYSFDEATQKKSLLIVEFKGKEKEVKKLAVEGLRDVKNLKGTFESLMEQGKKEPDDSFIFVTLTDDNPVYMPVDRLRDYYKNLLGLKSEYLTRKSEKEFNAIKKTSTDEEIFTQFLKQLCGCEEVEKEDVEMFAKTLKKIKED